MPASADQLEATLRDLPRIGQRIDSDDPRIELWRFKLDGKPYHLQFFERGDHRALRTFTHFQSLQKAGVPSPRASAVLKGFRLRDRVGDALILESIEPAASLRDLLAAHDLDGTPVPDRIGLRRQLAEILRKMALAKLGHPKLTLASFVIRAGDRRLFLVDAADVRRANDGARSRDLMHLAHDARGMVTQSDLMSIWTALDQDARSLPERNTLAPRLWRRFARTTVARDPSPHFARIRSGRWTGVFTSRAPRPVRWASASKERFTSDDWLAAWEKLLGQIERDELAVIKRDASGNVLRASVELHGQSFEVVVKRPRRKRLFQYAIDLFRHARARRGWVKSWKMLIRGVPCEWPMLLMERRAFGFYVADAIAVYEFVQPGTTLAAFDFDTLSIEPRANLFRRAGATLRQIDDAGFMHADAKSTNWIVFPDPVGGPRPILIDVDGVRPYRWPMMGFNRLMRALRDHPKFTPDDSYDLCTGYAPEARPVELHKK